MDKYYKIKAKTEAKNGVLTPIKLSGAIVLPPYKSDDQGVVISIADEGFAGQNEITSFIISGNVKYIGANAFNGCTGIKEITIPTSVTSIGNSAFSGCTGIKEITIPASVTSMGTSVFNGWSELSTIKVLGATTGWPTGWNGSADIDQHKYSISVNSNVGGTVAIKSGAIAVTEAAAGTSISINITSNSGYTISSVKFDNTALTENNDGAYSFIMPAKNVVVSVVFEEVVIDAEDYVVILQQSNSDPKARKINNILSSDTNITDDGLITNGYQVNLLTYVAPEEIPASIPIIYTVKPVIQVALYDTINEQWQGQDDWVCGTIASSVEVEIDGVQTTLSNVYATTYTGSNEMGIVPVRCLTN